MQVIYVMRIFCLFISGIMCMHVLILSSIFLHQTRCICAFMVLDTNARVNNWSFWVYIIYKTNRKNEKLTVAEEIEMTNAHRKK